MFVQNVLDFFHVGIRPNKRVSNKIDILVNGQMNVSLIFFGKCRQVNVFPRNVNAFMSAQNTFVLYPCHQHRTYTFNYFHVQCAIVEKHIVAYFNITGKVGIRHINYIVRSFHLRTTEDFNHIAFYIVNGFFYVSSSYFGSLCINKNTDVRRNCSYILYNITYAILSSMCCVHSNNVHSRKKKFADKILLAPAVAY